MPVAPLSAHTSSPLDAPPSKSSFGEGNVVPIQVARLRSNTSSIGGDLKSISPALHVSAKTGRIGANLGYFYLQKELKLSEHHMMKIMEKYPWIMYLKVDTNLRPTVEVLKSFGFRDKDVRSILEKVPPILGINHEWTLPEKLISLQKMFNLNRAGLVKLVVHQPFLLTCSIDRNIKVSEFLSETVGLSPESIRNCLLCCPEVAMSGITKMAACWSVLTDIYGLSDKQARALVTSYPIVLTHRTLKTIQDKVTFFSEELNMSPPFREVQKVIMRYPQLLCIDPNVFMRPNAALLRKYLELDREGIAKLISFFPSALGYNPKTLERAIRKSLFMLTGLDEYTTEQGLEEDLEDPDDIKIFQGEVQDISSIDDGRKLSLSSPNMLEAGITILREPISENILRPGPLLGQGLPLTAVDLQSIERAASVLDVQDGDILSLHILPSSMNPFLLMDGQDKDTTVSQDSIRAQIDIGADIYNTENDGDEYDDDSFEIQENGDFYDSRSKEDKNDSDLSFQSVAQSTGVDVMADIVARTRIKMEGRQPTHLSVSHPSTVILATISAIMSNAVNSQTALGESTIASVESASGSVEKAGGTVHESMYDNVRRPHVSVQHNTAAHAANEIEAMRLMMLVYSTLNIDKGRALSVVKSAPWVLSYRPERSLRMLSTIGFSLGMSRSELSKLVRSYPRVLSLSVDGKIREVLTALAVTASTCLGLSDTKAYLDRAALFKTRKGAEKGAVEQDGDGETELVMNLMTLASESLGAAVSRGGGVGSGSDVEQNADEVTTEEDLLARAEALGVACSSIALTRRRDPVRTMVRTAILKWPLLLGTSMSKINTGIEEILALEVPFDQLIQTIRRTPKSQLKWKNKVISMALAAQIKKELQLKKIMEKRITDEELSRTYYENEIDFGDDSEEIKMDSEADMEAEILQEEEKKKVKLDKKKKKAAFIKKIKKVLKPVLKTVRPATGKKGNAVNSSDRDIGSDASADTDADILELELDVDKKPKKRKATAPSQKKTKITSAKVEQI